MLSMGLHMCRYYGMEHTGCGIRLVMLDFHSYFVLPDKRKWGVEGWGYTSATIALTTDSAGVDSCLPMLTRDAVAQGCWYVRIRSYTGLIQTQ